MAKIQSVGDFLKIIKILHPVGGNAFFRGQSDNTWDVESSFCRLIRLNKIDTDQDNKRSYRLSNKLFQEFKKNMPIYSEHNSLQGYSLNDLDLMIMAQHYGLSTRLIDWTKNPLIALYFATENQDAQPKNDCSVFMTYNTKKNEVTSVSSDGFVSNVIHEQKTIMDVYNFLESNFTQALDLSKALKLNNIIDRNTTTEFIYPPIKLADTISSIDISSLILRIGVNHTIPCERVLSMLKEKINTVNYLTSLNNIKIFNNTTYIIEPLPINHRIKNQQGVLAFSNETTKAMIPCNNFDNSNIITNTNFKLNEDNKDIGVFRIDIPKKHISKIHQELSIYGITKDFIYPELPSYTETMQKRLVSQAINGKI